MECNQSPLFVIIMQSIVNWCVSQPSPTKREIIPIAIINDSGKYEGHRKDANTRQLMTSLVSPPFQVGRRTKFLNMPRERCEQPARLDDICLVAYKNYLLEEFNLISQLRKFERSSVVLQQFEVTAERALAALEHALGATVKGIFHDIVRQKLVKMLLPELSRWLVVDSSSSSSSALSLAAAGQFFLWQWLFWLNTCGYIIKLF